MAVLPASSRPLPANHRNRFGMRAGRPLLRMACPLLVCLLTAAPHAILGALNGAAAASLVIDAESGAVLQAEEPTRPWYPASLAKLMTVYLTLEALRDGRLALAQEVPVSTAAAGQPPTKLGLRAGRSITVETALLAVIVRSANDAAVVLAEAVAGSERAFAEAMTAKARALGMSASRFRNASGLPDPAQVTTARDMAILASALVATFPDRLPLFRQRALHYGGRSLPTINGWLTSFEGAEGLKTGFTCASGYNLVALASRGGRRLIGVLLGGADRQSRDGQMRRLMERAFAAPRDAAQGGLAELRPAAQDGPPEVLSQAACGSVASSGNGRLPGWGILFGSFPSKGEARAVIERNREALAGGGRAAILPSARWGRTRHAALLVGLRQADAGRACQSLAASGRFCQTLSPQILNNPKAVWR